MFVAPAPVSLLIVVGELGKRDALAMILFYIHAIRLVFVGVPMMLVIVLSVVEGYLDLFIGGERHGWRHDYRD